MNFFIISTSFLKFHFISAESNQFSLFFSIKNIKSVNKNGLWKWLLHNPAAIFISASCIVVLSNGKVLPFFFLNFWISSSDCCVVPSLKKSQIFANLLDRFFSYLKLICVNKPENRRIMKTLLTLEWIQYHITKAVHKLKIIILQIFVRCFCPSLLSYLVFIWWKIKSFIWNPVI